MSSIDRACSIGCRRPEQTLIVSITLGRYWRSPLRARKSEAEKIVLKNLQSHDRFGNRAESIFLHGFPTYAPEYF
jgi:hypothetical protein